MAVDQPLIVVTGGNRGIGFEVCRQLIGRGARVVLTARNRVAGEEAVARLSAQGLSARFHPLDVINDESIQALQDALKRDSGRI
jgi:NAD(P)-dependent dehydrogenase (short-subunit alcohol dehydrogenase family)